MWLVVGLGNPGREYAEHRHNVGFMVVDALAARAGAPAFRDKFSGEMARCALGGEDALLFKPLTYMNRSGDAVQPCAAFFKIPRERVVVVHDELDIPFGDIRLKKGGGHGGHNGLRSIIGRLGADFGRVRMGIGRPPASFRGDVADFVLSAYDATEREKLSNIVKAGAESVLSIAAHGFDAAMKSRNTRKKQEKKQKEEKPPASAAAPVDAPEPPPTPEEDHPSD
ncbi:MAG: aminoacyl-tRNA hydrolase [Myxococcota bacterium]